MVISPSPSLAPSLAGPRVDAVLERVAHATRSGPRDVPPSRHPVHVVYGGAHLFTRDTIDKLGRIARKSFEDHASSADLFASPEVFARVSKKLETDAVEALCIDFEDGFGPRPEDEEDAQAVRAATELAAIRARPGPGPLTRPGPLVGVRIKALSGPTARRGARTIDLFVSALAAGGPIREGFSVTLPKVSHEAEVAALCELLTMLEQAHGIAPGTIRVELMIETARALFDETGRLAVSRLVDAAGERCVAVHLGAYDLTAELGVNATEQRLDHPACDLARLAMSAALAGRGIAIFDGATTTMPVGEPEAVRRAWSIHASNVRRAIDFGIFQGWDLHPAQLPARYAALFEYFSSRRGALSARLAAFVDRATQAMRIGQTFDDAATAQGLLNFFLRGVSCGALDESDVAATTLTLEELRSRSFAQIVQARGQRP